MIEFSVSSSGTEFSELAQKISGPLKQKLIERVTDIAYAEAFWGAPVKTGYLASTIYKQISNGEGVVGVAASYGRIVVEGSAPHEIRAANGGILSFMVAGKRSSRRLFIIPELSLIRFCRKQLTKLKAKLTSLLQSCGSSW